MLMIDIETLGKGPKKVIVQIGWAYAQNVYGQIKSGGVNVCPQSCIYNGGEMDVSTVEWWITEGGAEAYRTTLDAREHIRYALEILAGVIETYQPDTVWVSAPMFDFTGLKFYYDALDVPVPWAFRQERCFRTFREEIPAAKALQPEDCGVAHNATDDAVYQLEWLLAIKRTCFSHVD